MYKYIHIYIYIGQLDMADPPVPKGMLITDATVSPFISDLIDELGYERVRRCLLQCAAVCCSVLQCAAVCCSALTSLMSSATSVCAGVCCSVLQCVAVCCNVRQCVAVH